MSQIWVVLHACKLANEGPISAMDIVVDMSDISAHGSFIAHLEALGRQLCTLHLTVLQKLGKLQQAQGCAV